MSNNDLRETLNKVSVKLTGVRLCYPSAVREIIQEAIDDLDALPQPAPSPQPAVPVVSDEQIEADTRHFGWTDAQVISFAAMILLQGNRVESIEMRLHTFREHEKLRGHLAPEALRPAVEPITPEQMRKAAMDEMNKIPALANFHLWKGWPGTWAFATAAVNGITAKAEGGA